MDPRPLRNIPRPTPTVKCDPPPTNSAFEQSLQAAVDAGEVLHLNESITIDAPVSIRLRQSHQAWHGIDGHNYKIVSKVRGGPVMRFYMDESVPQGTCTRSFVCQGFSLIGGGEEEGGLVFDIPYNDRWLVNPLWRDIWIEGTAGKAGLSIVGSIFEGNLYCVGTMDCKENGVYLGNSGPPGNVGIVSALRWYGGTQRQNGAAGILVDAYDGPADIRYYGLYFCANRDTGISTLAGIELADGCGFENNGGQGIYFNNFAKLQNCTGSTNGSQQYLVRGFLANPVLMSGCSMVGYLGGDPKLANLSGQGEATLIASGDGRDVEASGNVTVKIV